MEALQPLTDVLGALEPPGVKTVLQAAALDLLGRTDEVDEQAVIELLGDPFGADVDASEHRNVLKAAQFLLREASQFKLTKSKMVAKLGKVGWDVASAEVVHDVLAWASEKSSEMGDEKPPSIADLWADVNSDPFTSSPRGQRRSTALRTSQIFETEAAQSIAESARGSILGDDEPTPSSGGGGDGGGGGGLYDDLDDELEDLHSTPAPARVQETPKTKSKLSALAPERAVAALGEFSQLTTATSAKKGSKLAALEAAVAAAPTPNPGKFQFRHIEIPRATVIQEWKENGGQNVYITYELRSFVTVRVEVPRAGANIGFDCDEELKVTSVSPELAFSHVSIGTRLMAFNDRPLGKSVGWSKVKPVVEAAAAPRSFTFAVLKPFVVRKRFSEFDEMRNIVMEVLGAGAALPSLPKKTLLRGSAMDPKFIKQRREKLEQFSQALLQTGPKGALANQIEAISTHADVLAFLGVQAGGNQAAVEPLRVNVTTSDHPSATDDGGFTVDERLWVTGVAAGSRAAQAGVKEGWRLVAFQNAQLPLWVSGCNSHFALVSLPLTGPMTLPMFERGEWRTL